MQIANQVRDRLLEQLLLLHALLQLLQALDNVEGLQLAFRRTLAPMRVLSVL